jgi:hypothetical protein
MFKRLMFAALLLTTPLARADEFDGKKTLSTDERAAVELDQEQAHKDIEKKYEGDNSSEARHAKAAEIRDADNKVLDDHHVDLKDYTWQSSHDSRDAQKELKDKKVALKEKREKEAKEKAEADQKAKEPGEPEVIRGFDDSHPLNLDDPGAPKPKKEAQLDAEGNPIPEVEKGIRDEDMEGPKVETGEGGEGAAPAAAAGGEAFASGGEAPSGDAASAPPAEEGKKKHKHHKKKGEDE